MKKLIFGIFAHPDDEAFGPVGTLLTEKAAGSEVHLICATAGENGTNPDNDLALGDTRLQEWQAAGELLDSDSMHYLGYEDGTLSNSVYLEAAHKIQRIVGDATEGRDDISSIEFLSLDANGLTGHIDHIFVSRVACYVFYTLKETDERFSKIRLNCLHRDDFPEPNRGWLYMDAGRTPEEISETVDASAHLDMIKNIMQAHNSQRGDCESILTNMGDQVAINHFLVLS
ncbi:MAG: PIG-L family deacetylase [Candidatus Saccharimonadales bacterium]